MSDTTADAPTGELKTFKDVKPFSELTPDELRARLREAGLKAATEMIDGLVKVAQKVTTSMAAKACENESEMLRLNNGAYYHVGRIVAFREIAEMLTGIVNELPSSIRQMMDELE